MTLISVVPVGAVDRRVLEQVATAVSAAYRVPCNVLRAPVDPSRTLHPERRQYHSTEILEMLSALRIPGRTLGVAAVDLYIPILTFVFGEAQLAGECAVVSTYRMAESLYGFQEDESVERERVLKCAIHEIGHTYGLTHCDDQECVMAAAHAVEWIDVKRASLCDVCRERCETHRQCGVSL